MHSDLSRVANRFRCRRCDGTIQEAALGEGMSVNCAPTQVCRKSASRPGYVVKVRTDPGYVVKQCPRIVMNKIFDWH